MAEENNALRNLLRAGTAYGTSWAEGKLFGSSPASNEALQVEKVQRGRINGSGPVNASASLLAPATWTEFFFGTRQGVGTDGEAAAPAPNPLRTIALAVIAGLIVWYLVKRFGK
jgi:hypothetical protein